MSTTFNILMHVIIILVAIYYTIKYNAQKNKINDLLELNDSTSNYHKNMINKLLAEIDKLKKELSPIENTNKESLTIDNNNVKKAKKTKKTNNEKIS